MEMKTCVSIYYKTKGEIHMKKLLQQIVTASLILTLLFCTPISASAQEVAEDGTLLTTELESSVEVFSMLRGTYLNTGKAYISVPGTGYACGSGTTVANSAVSSIGLALYIQRYNGSGWTTVYQWSVSGSNTAYLSSTKTYAVTRGYYYRVYTTHSAGGEFMWNSTSGIYIA